jgi:hypothetical protein
VVHIAEVMVVVGMGGEGEQSEEGKGRERRY